MNRLYINGQQADISPNMVIAMTYRFYSPLTPNVVRVGYSNKFSLPRTANNNNIFDLASDEKSVADVVKTRMECRYVQDGIEVIIGTLAVLEVDDFFRCVIFSRDSDFFSLIKDKTLNDLDYTDVEFDADAIYAYRMDGEVGGGYGEVFTPVVYLGRNLINNGGTVDYIDNRFIVSPYVNSFVPLAFGYKRILQRIISQSGFSYDMSNLASAENPVITYVGSGALSSSASGTTIDIVAPSVLDDDIMILFAFGRDNLTHSISGWTQIGTQQNNTAALTCTLWWRRAVFADGGATFTLTKSANNGQLFTGIIAAWRGCSTASDVVTSCGTPSVSANGISATLTYASFTPSKRCHVIAAGFYGDDGSVTNDITGTIPSFINRFREETSVGSDGTIYGYSGYSNALDVTGIRTHDTEATAARSIGIVFGLSPIDPDSPVTKFNSLAVMQAGYSDEYRFQYSEKFRQSVNFSAAVDADETFTSIGAAASRVLQFLNTLVPCDFYEADPAGVARSRYRVSFSGTTLGYFTGTFRYKGKVNLASGAGKISINVNGTETVQASGVQTLSVGDNEVDIYIDYNTYYQGFKDGDILQIWWTQTSANPCVMTYYAGGTFSFECAGAGQYVLLNEILPSVNQLDFYKDFLFRFGQIPKETNKKLVFKSLKDILDGYSDLNDWSAKRNKNTQTVSHHLDLAQRNYFQYKSGDDDVPEKFGSGYFDLDDATLDEESVTEGVFTSSLDTSTEGISCARILCQEDPSANSLPLFSKDTGARLLLTRLKYTQEPSIRVVTAGSPVSNYIVGCFTKIDTTDSERSASYQKVLEEWYTTSGMDTGFLERLKNAKVVTRYYNLSAIDIAKYDPHKMIFDDGHYIFPVIKNFLPGKITEVEMLKI